MQGRSVESRLVARVRVKICGVTSAREARCAAAAGADAVGLVFYRASRRAVSEERAGAIARATPAFVSRIALFLDPSAADVARVLDAVRPDCLQFHGRETPAFCAQFGAPYIKTVPMGEPGVEPAEWAERYADARGLLLDANRAGEAGGRGTRFDWGRGAARPDAPIIVAGGLDAANVGASIDAFAPYAVDVSSGVEDSDGQKSPARMQAFVNAALAATGEQR